ncbi:glycosyltransferase family 4 protein [Alkalilimnicola sp. S0819]|uniref:glycosyltransferase family 4 protein n=1 Tax=Alkalilimnicola sp. S0819 TaxID=2613922 RepID=UPI0012629EF9|nr:glycosyltransferase family 4 protein [Alkalilimnicola sp. S0819]KAB7624005.1 glycosyltransferase family 4 protein [Alkalilimnicola sp. S0819]MPQ16613.1 glycosyltransferase [Alkalilimnicola sp. S0819]
MHIAQIAPLYESVPPRLYGGTERVVSYLTEELVAQGHQVTLFASGDSRTRAKLHPVTPRALRLDPERPGSLPPHLCQLDQVARRRGEFDILHFHIDYLHFPLSRALRLPHLTTLHGRLDLPELPPLYRQFPDMPVVSISDAQRRPLPGAGWRATIHHGLPTTLYTFSDRPGEHLVFIGRISPEKRLDRAIEIALRSGRPLKVAAKVDPADQDYFHRHIAPLLAHPQVEYLGEVDDARKQALLGGAAALLFPIDWPEPFGMVMIEAMACGTPVIAWDHGSVPELIRPGVNGFVVRSIDEAVAAVARLPELDRRSCRNLFERHFSAERMARDYLRLYDELLVPHGTAKEVRAWRRI